VFHHYRRLIELRHTMPIVVAGDFQLSAAEDPKLFAYLRTLDDERLLVVANMSNDEVRFVPPAEFARGKSLIGTASETLAPWQSYAVVTTGIG